MKQLRAELKLNETQMKGTGTSVDALEQREKLLKQELQASGDKVTFLSDKLRVAKEVFGENSIEASNWSAKLADAKRVQETIAQELSSTTGKLDEQKEAESELSQEALEAAEKLKKQAEAEAQLQSAVEQADQKIKQLDQELELNQTKLDGSENKTSLLRDRQVLLANQSQIVAQKTATLQSALDACSQEVGENSEKYNELKSSLAEAQTQQAAIQNEIRNTTKELSEQKSTVQTFGEGLGKFGEGTEKVGQSLRTVSTTAAGALTGAAASAITFEDAFAGVKKTSDEVYNANGQCVYSYQQLEDGIRNMAKEIPASTTEIASVAETAGQLGIKTQDVLGFTRVMIDMGNSTNLAADDAATAIAKFANVTGLAADQSMSAEEKYSKMGSTIVDLGNNYATTEADIMNMATNLASAGTQVGMSESDILALATALSSVGMEAQAGGTAFSKAMVQMQIDVETNSEGLKDWANVAGMSVDEFSTLFREDATGALEAFIAGLSQCGGETDSAIKVLDDMGITETRMRDALLRSANASDVFTSAIQTGNEAWNENTALTEEANKRYETTKSKIQIMGNNLKDVGITLGSTFLPMIAQGTEKIKGFADAISQMDSNQQKILLGILGFVAILSPLLIGIGKVSTGISAIIGVGSKLTGMIAGIGTAAEGAGAAAAGGAGIALGPILLIVAAIAAITGAIALLWQKSESFRDFFTELFGIFQDTISGFLDSLDISGKIDEIKQTLGGFEEKILGLEDLFEIVGTVLAIIIIPALAQVAAGFSMLLSIINPILTIIGGLIDQLSGLGTFIVGVFTGDMDKAYQGLQTWKSGVGTTFSGLWSLVVGGLNGFLSGLVNFFTSLLHVCGLDSFTNGVKNTFEGIKNGISTKINAARDTVKSAIEKIKSFFNFTWKLPELKVPDIAITGSFSLNPPSVPHFSVKWHADGAIFSRPTIFQTRSGFHGVGEAGEEAVAPITLLRSYVEESVENALARLQRTETDPIDYDRLADAMARRKVTVEYNGREFGRIIEEVAT